ncbi:hypothetical protein HDU79_006390 [Rhizoclosmatium sp. JEL0117]|nr:hypothetical protein HDU79_006390 [Rhizoclosmatium sp. JEL0117]
MCLASLNKELADIHAGYSLHDNKTCEDASRVVPGLNKSFPVSSDSEHNDDLSLSLRKEAIECIANQLDKAMSDISRVHSIYLLSEQKLLIRPSRLSRTVPIGNMMTQIVQGYPDLFKYK